MRKEYKEYANFDPKAQSRFQKLKTISIELLKVISIFESNEGITF